MPRFTFTLTPKQKLYIFVLQGLGAMVLDAGINAGLAWVMYDAMNEDKDKRVWLYAMPSPFIVDIIGTAIIEPFLTWVLVGVFIRRDVRGMNIAAMALVIDDTKQSDSDSVCSLGIGTGAKMSEKSSEMTYNVAWPCTCRCGSSQQSKKQKEQKEQKSQCVVYVCGTDGRRVDVTSMRQHGVEWTKARWKLICNSASVFIFWTFMLFAPLTLLVLIILDASDAEFSPLTVTQAMVCKAAYAGVMGLFITPVAAFFALVGENVTMSTTGEGGTNGDRNLLRSMSKRVGALGLADQDGMNGTQNGDGKGLAVALEVQATSDAITGSDGDEPKRDGSGDHVGVEAATEEG